MSKQDYTNDSAVRQQLEQVLKLRKQYAAASVEKDALAKQGNAELAKLNRLLAGKAVK